MKQLVAILFLLLLSFNLAGYRILFYLMQQQADIELQAALDKEAYNEQDLITLRVPLSLPYTTDTKEFERVDGEVTVDGIIYKYVKRKVEHGQLVLLCLPDKNKTSLETARDEFFKLANDFVQNGSEKKSSSNPINSLKILLSHYDAPMTEWTSAVLIKEIKHHYIPYHFSTGSTVIATLEQPPEWVNA